MTKDEIASEVLQILRDRQSRPKGEPAERPHKLGLVIQGGGMRGAYSLGAVKALEHYSNEFDHVLGSSSGAINAAYFVTQQCDSAAAGYCLDLACRDFINMRRFRRIIDIDFLIDDVVKKSQRLSIEKLQAAAPTVHAVVTAADTGAERVVTSRDGGIDFYEVLRATAALPLVYGKSVRLGEGLFIDGGIVDAIPFFRAVELGCTHIVVVLTNSLRRQRTGFGRFVRAILRHLTTNLGPGAFDRLVTPDELFNRTLKTLSAGFGEFLGAKFIVVTPSNLSRLSSRLTSDTNLLTESTRLGFEDMSDAMSLPASQPWPKF